MMDENSQEESQMQSSNPPDQSAPSGSSQESQEVFPIPAEPVQPQAEATQPQVQPQSTASVSQPSNRQRVKIKRIGILSYALFSGLAGVIMGLIFGLLTSLFSLFGMAIGAAFSSDSSAGLLSLVFGIGALIIFPIIYGGMAFVFGALGAIFYNIIAKIMGGIAIEFEPNNK
ncbi:hypothetical protein COS81_00310 [candidate division WWE3 bacterium CG06_land_8_20_14_3_00_42_16]|uniref:DUF3566 domain-containing protein n=2 Tax=Katanobacteria TaxID=422282 RepID=A0A2M7APN4_UNCKA|nr:MAG: hypothetical protein AUJ38_02770 [bacterium CG1_02_42_9]PIU69334.1 MAG: hypothetical protein COS81_00310 [candidate division WWE3 bacterium CG06_land_8_20_14_3_00_42_16]PJC69177.1 MAG: hypothetical protein CO015_01310 [candidate division WWE3 bacterium CG_4_8_14_3_um_filter_42_11]